MQVRVHYKAELNMKMKEFTFPSRVILNAGVYKFIMSTLTPVLSLRVKVSCKKGRLLEIDLKMKVESV